MVIFKMAQILLAGKNAIKSLRYTVPGRKRFWRYRLREDTAAGLHRICETDRCLSPAETPQGEGKSALLWKDSRSGVSPAFSGRRPRILKVFLV